MALKANDIELIKTPSECPECKVAIHPLIEFIGKGNWDRNAFVTLRCPRQECYVCFTYEYELFSFKTYEFVRIINGKKDSVTFSKAIQKISSNFCIIYNEAFAAEQCKLFEICGVGYRKSLEFLIKDFLISKHPTENETIKKHMLMPCIDKYLKDTNIAKTGKRAVWLGNDQTHYERKWEANDLNDLKKLISLTVSWIEQELYTDEFETSMPDKK